jgi:hypothetical protein
MPAPVRTDRELLDAARAALARLVDSLQDQHADLTHHPRSAEFADGARRLADAIAATKNLASAVQSSKLPNTHE